jgi:hypothetical protein
MNATSPTPSLTDVIARRQETSAHHGNVDRDETIKAIRAALKQRSGKTWSVTGGRGTVWGWINITAPPRRCTGDMIQHAELRHGQMHYAYEHIDTCTQTGCMTPQDAAELAELLGLEKPVHYQGASIASSNAHYIEYIARAEGRTPSAFGKQYWD